MARQCLIVAITQQSASQAVVEEEQIPQQSMGPEVGLGIESQGVLSEELEKIMIGQDEEKFFQVGSQLLSLEKAALVKFLEENMDVFTQSTYGVPGIDPEFICHQLNVNPEATLRRQPPQCLSKKHAEAVRVKVNKLKQARAIKEIFYPEWLANTVVVKKKNRKWRVCVDFMDLNKVCLKDHFPVPQID